MWCLAIWQIIVVDDFPSIFRLSVSYWQLPELYTDSQSFAKTVNSSTEPDRSIIKYKPIN